VDSFAEVHIVDEQLSDSESITSNKNRSNDKNA
jgi:hypothetical protein